MVALGGTLGGVTWHNSVADTTIRTNASVKVEISLDNGSTWPYSQTITAPGSNLSLSASSPVTIANITVTNSTTIRVRVTLSSARAGNAKDGYHTAQATVYVYDVVLLCTN